MIPLNLGFLRYAKKKWLAKIVGYKWLINLAIVCSSSFLLYALVNYIGLESGSLHNLIKDNTLPYHCVIIIVEVITLYLINKYQVFWLTTALIVGASIRLFFHLVPLAGLLLAAALSYFAEANTIKANLSLILDCYIYGYYYAIISTLVILQGFAFAISPLINGKCGSYSNSDI